ncbi:MULTISPECIES: helix-turn-helix domain-containing protein [Cyanophyceae]|uniref:helix-turn-helix domain-containing protein n=1 Tax=Cyanophyceae TaxID=3028117 RepID=UPI00168467A2|nr:helix-turn-helix transcriptional regulator [Trichocoleus sp. FACHB-40]MBD2006337.1 helix-turn-helix transcriptional regulator [Trichocoleus sp. FACHB-40]
MTAPSLARREKQKKKPVNKRAWFDAGGLQKLGQILRETREQKNLSLDDLYEVTGFPRSTINNLENGATESVNVPLLDLLCEILEPINPKTGAPYGTWELLSMALVSRPLNIVSKNRALLAFGNGEQKGKGKVSTTTIQDLINECLHRRQVTLQEIEFQLGEMRLKETADMSFQQLELIFRGEVIPHDEELRVIRELVDPHESIFSEEEWLKALSNQKKSAPCEEAETNCNFQNG